MADNVGGVRPDWRARRAGSDSVYGTAGGVARETGGMPGPILRGVEQIHDQVNLREKTQVGKFRRKIYSYDSCQLRA